MLNITWKPNERFASAFSGTCPRRSWQKGYACFTCLGTLKTSLSHHIITCDSAAISKTQASWLLPKSSWKEETYQVSCWDTFCCRCLLLLLLLFGLNKFEVSVLSFQKGILANWKHFSLRGVVLDIWCPVNLKSHTRHKERKISHQNTSENSIHSPQHCVWVFIIIIINPLTARFVGAPQMILQPVFSIFLLFSTALWDLTNSRPVHFLMLSSHLFLCLPCLLPDFTVPCKMVLARPDGRETWPYHCSLRIFTIVRRSSCGLIACWVLARTSSLVTWSLFEYYRQCIANSKHNKNTVHRITS